MKALRTVMTILQLLDFHKYGRDHSYDKSDRGVMRRLMVISGSDDGSESDDNFTRL